MLRLFAMHIVGAQASCGTFTTSANTGFFGQYTIGTVDTPVENCCSACEASSDCLGFQLYNDECTLQGGQGYGTSQLTGRTAYAQQGAHSTRAHTLSTSVH